MRLSQRALGLKPGFLILWLLKQDNRVDGQCLPAGQAGSIVDGKINYRLLTMDYRRAQYFLTIVINVPRILNV